MQPAIVFVATARLSVVSARGIEGAPTLGVAVLSPSTAPIDRGVKLQLARIPGTTVLLIPALHR